jgi:hypothetical protein
MDVDQVAQIVGALLVLAGYVGGQAGRLDPHSLWYLMLNLVGAGVLSVVAAIDSDWGFLLLEGVWTLVSAWSLARVLTGHHPASTTE